MTRVHEDPARIAAVVELASRDLRGMETHITTEGQVREAVAHAREMSSSAQGLYGLHEVACPSVSHRLPTLNEPTTQLGAEYEREGQSRIDSYSPGGTHSPALSYCCLAPAATYHDDRRAVLAGRPAWEQPGLSPAAMRPLLELAPAELQAPGDLGGQGGGSRGHAGRADGAVAQESRLDQLCAIFHV